MSRLGKAVDLQEIGESTYLGALRAAAVLWLDLRQDVLCELSCEEGEWMETDPEHGRMIETLGTMRVIAERLRHYAEMVTTEERESRDVIWAVLDEQANKWDHVVRVPWEKKPED